MAVSRFIRWAGARPEIVQKRRRDDSIGRDPLVGNILSPRNDSKKDGEIRLMRRMVISRTAVYLGGIWRSYSSPIWRAVIGEITPQEALRRLDSINFRCTPSALDLKASPYIAKHPEIREELEAPLVGIIDLLKLYATRRADGLQK